MRLRDKPQQPLPLPTRAVTVRVMYALARILQLAGLVILPLAMVSQLTNQISLGEMLQFLLVGAGLFAVGYLLQRYGSR